MTRFVAIALVLIASPAAAADCYSWPLRDPPNYDGDTLYITLAELPAELQDMSVRVRGVDTPETRGPDCEEERTAGAAATVFARAQLEGAGRVEFCQPEWGVYGRIVATVMVDGQDLAQLLIGAGHGRYCGDVRCGSWCG